MNERIKELLEQSTNPPWDGELGAAGESNLEKFAQVMELSMDITTNSNWCWNTLNV